MWPLQNRTSCHLAILTSNGQCKKGEKRRTPDQIVRRPYANAGRRKLAKSHSALGDAGSLPLLAQRSFSRLYPPLFVSLDPYLTAPDRRRGKSQAAGRRRAPSQLQLPASSGRDACMSCEERGAVLGRADVFMIPPPGHGGLEPGVGPHRLSPGDGKTDTGCGDAVSALLRADVTRRHGP